MCFISAHYIAFQLTLFNFLIFFSFSGSPVSSASASATGNLGADTIVESPFVTTEPPAAVAAVAVQAAPL